MSENKILSSTFSYYKAIKLKINYKEKNFKNWEKHEHMDTKQYASY